MSEENSRICENCKLKIAPQNYVTHTLHCLRHLECCKQCAEPIPKDKMIEHIAQEHAIETCVNCGTVMEKSLMQNHIQLNCSKRLIPCPYCDLALPSCDMDLHTDYCGTRTETCTECGELVMLKYNQLHLESNHNFIKLEDEPGPSASWQQKPRTIPVPIPEIPEDSNATLLPCQFCDGMFVPEELRRHQISCTLGWQTSVPVLHRISTIKCEYCRKLIASKEYASHRSLCFESTLLRPSPKAQSDLRSSGTIPCNICTRDIAFEEYKKHHSQCTDSSNLSNPGSSQSEVTPFSTAVIPCDICNQLVDFEGYLQHHSTCDQSARAQNSIDHTDFGNNVTTQLPCEFCEESFSPERLAAHQITCFPRNQQATIPCELCGESKPLAEVFEHQLTCRISGDF